MPFLRVVRDKRGYEVTYLMHLYREGHRQRSRILYMFRTPGGVRVGRPALDPDVLRQIEAQHPDVTFDWKQVRESQQVIELAADLRRPRSRVSEAGGSPPAVPAPASPPAAPPEPKAQPVPPVPGSIAGDTPDEQIAFLGEWYPKLRDRVPQRTSDPARQQALLALTERLNPASWTDADQITTGLQQAAEALERLSRVFARRRRGARRRRQKQAPTEPPSTS